VHPFTNESLRIGDDPRDGTVEPHRSIDGMCQQITRDA